MYTECPLCRLMLHEINSVSRSTCASLGDVEWFSLDYIFDLLGSSDYAQAHVRQAYVHALVGKKFSHCEDLIRLERQEAMTNWLSSLPRQTRRR